MQSILFTVLKRMRKPLIVLLCVYAVSIVGFTLITGQDDQGQPWTMDFFHAIYFVSYMGSTIGFGELPYPFTGAQRLWALFSIYTTVISWLYAIGTLISLLQSAKLRHSITHNSFVRSVARIRSDFYLVCGYGDTGSPVVAALVQRGFRCVVIDQDQSRIDELELENLPMPVPALCNDAADVNILRSSGLANSRCRGVIAITRNDDVNLKIALSCKLTRPSLPVYCWSENQATADNMASFGTDHIISPYETFAGYLTLAFQSPSQYLLNQWLTSPINTPLVDPIYPPQGAWILCGYGRFGRACYNALKQQGFAITVIEVNPQNEDLPANTIVGRGTEASTLHEAGINNAVGIIAGSDNDVNNLSILMTARTIKPSIFTITRQEYSNNGRLFKAAGADLVTHHSDVIAGRLSAVIMTPLTDAFLNLAKEQDEEWARVLVSRLLGCVDNKMPSTWVVSINRERASAINEWMNRKRHLELKHLMRQPEQRDKNLSCIGLLLKRDEELHLLPDTDTKLRTGDRILFCGNLTAKTQQNRIATSSPVLQYLITGKDVPVGTLWSWLQERREQKPKTKD